MNYNTFIFLKYKTGFFLVYLYEGYVRCDIDNFSLLHRTCYPIIERNLVGLTQLVGNRSVLIVVLVGCL